MISDRFTTALHAALPNESQGADMAKSKAQRIVALLEAGVSLEKIALRVGCRREYVRAVKSRVFGDYDHEGNLKRSNERRRERYRTDAAYRARRIGIVRRSQARAAQTSASISRPSSS